MLRSPPSCFFAMGSLLQPNCCLIFCFISLSLASMSFGSLSQLTGWCSQPQPVLQPFGVNPHFLPSSSLYDPEAARLLQTDPAALNSNTFGALQAFNPQGLPYGFIYPRVRVVLANPHATSFQANLEVFILRCLKILVVVGEWAQWVNVSPFVRSFSVFVASQASYFIFADTYATSLMWLP